MLVAHNSNFFFRKQFLRLFNEVSRGSFVALDMVEPVNSQMS